MDNYFIVKNILFIITILGSFLFNISQVNSETLNQRITEYPHWDHQLSLPTPREELIFPSWFEGRWNVGNTLKEQIAPLSPRFKTPGFDSNAEYIDREINFQVQFIPIILPPKNDNFVASVINKEEVIIPDRAFNGLSISQAYLGAKKIKNVIISKDNSAEQITKFEGENELISTVIGRKQETLSNTYFLTSEVTGQFFRRPNSIYLNLVETTTKYHLINKDYIQGQQVTAIYLSPQDPDYFLAFDKPVALYYYVLDLHRKKI